MSKLILIRFSAALATIVALSALAVLFISQASVAAAKPASSQAVHSSFHKGDRLPCPAKGSACSIHGWPHYEQRCLFDLRVGANEAQAVRVIAMH